MSGYKYLKGSDGTGLAVMAHIDAPRAIGATVLSVDSLDNWPAEFMVVTGQLNADGFLIPGTMTEMKAHQTAGDIIIEGFAPGYTDQGNTTSPAQVAVLKPTTHIIDSLVANALVAHEDDGTLQPDSLDHFYRPSEVSGHNFVSSGGVIAITAGLTASFSNLVYYISGLRYTKTGVANRAYGLSKDTYVDIGTDGTLDYNEVANGAATPALAANHIRLAKVVTSAAAITSIVQYGKDSLNNTIYPNAPIGSSELDGSDLSLNMKYVYNNATVNPSGTSTNNYGNAHGLVTSMVFTKPTPVLIHCSINASSTTDFEFHPIIFINDVEVKRTTPVAAPGFAGNRSTERSVAYQALLQPGAYTFKGGAFFSSGTSISSPANSCFLWVIALGKVTS